MYQLEITRSQSTKCVVSIQNNTKYGGIHMSVRIMCVCVLKFLNRKLTYPRCMGTDLVYDLKVISYTQYNTQTTARLSNDFAYMRPNTNTRTHEAHHTVCVWMCTNLGIRQPRNKTERIHATHTRVWMNDCLDVLCIVLYCMDRIGLVWIGCFSFYLYSHSISPSTFTECFSPFHSTHTLSHAHTEREKLQLCIEILIILSKYTHIIHTLGYEFFFFLSTFVVCSLYFKYFLFCTSSSPKLSHSCFSKWADNRLSCLKSFETKWKSFFAFVLCRFAESSNDKIRRR